MNKEIIFGAAVLGLGIGVGIAFNTGDQPNRHFTSSTVAHIHIEEPSTVFSTSLPMRLELTLNENNTYGVFAMLPQSQVGFSGKGQYSMDSDGILFMHDMHTPLDLEGAKGGVIEQLFVRPGSFDGLMNLIDIGDKGSILVGKKVALHLES
ncbi:hypothetical protein [Vibrio bivalvicida]|uniref:Uncharacterized protein n=1 Tax=Vibrio bivalvicida TaxID=1276888 RepID=A0ABV4MNZ3_9VIBR